MMREPQTIDFSALPRTAIGAEIEGKLVLADNFEKKTSGHPHVTPMSAPVKLNMSLIFLCTEGSMTIRINLQEYVLTPHHVATLTFNSFMQIMEMSQDFRGYFIAISKDFVDYSQDFRIGLALIHQHYEIPVSLLNEKNYQDAIDIYHLLKRKLNDPDYIYKEQVTRNYLNILRYNGLQAIQEGVESTQPLIANHKDDMLQQFKSLVKTHYKTERQVTFYASKMGITPKYLSTIIKEVSGKFANDWINEFVILEAKALLKNSDMPIKNICEELHFLNTSIFTKYFKQHTGFTPKEYRTL